MWDANRSNTCEDSELQIKYEHYKTLQNHYQSFVKKSCPLMNVVTNLSLLTDTCNKEETTILIDLQTVIKQNWLKIVLKYLLSHIYNSQKVQIIKKIKQIKSSQAIINQIELQNQDEHSSIHTSLATIVCGGNSKTNHQEDTLDIASVDDQESHVTPKCQYDIKDHYYDDNSSFNSIIYVNNNVELVSCSPTPCDTPKEDNAHISVVITQAMIQETRIIFEKIRDRDIANDNCLCHQIKLEEKISDT